MHKQTNQEKWAKIPLKWTWTFTVVLSLERLTVYWIYCVVIAHTLLLCDINWSSQGEHLFSFCLKQKINGLWSVNMIKEQYVERTFDHMSETFDSGIYIWWVVRRNKNSWTTLISRDSACIYSMPLWLLASIAIRLCPCYFHAVIQHSMH